MLITAPQFPDAHVSPSRPPAAGSAAGTRVWLVRHAEVDARFQGTAYGNSDVPLSEHGVRQTRELCAAFAAHPLQHVTSSRLARALELGRGLSAATRAELVIDERLREIWRGEWQGLDAEEFRARWAGDSSAFFADPWNWKGHRGESDAEVCARAWPVLLETLGRAAARAPDHAGEVALATHFNVIRVLVTHALGWRAKESYAFRNEPAHATLLVDAPGGFQLAAANLPAAQVADLRRGAPADGAWDGRGV